MVFHAHLAALVPPPVGVDARAAVNYATGTRLTANFPVDAVSVPDPRRAAIPAVEALSVPDLSMGALQAPEGIAALDPQRDMPVEVHKRTMTPIGAPSSPMPVQLGFPATSRPAHQLPYVSPLASSFPGLSNSATGLPAWPRDDSLVSTSYHSHEPRIPLHTPDILPNEVHESLEALQLGPAVHDRNPCAVPPPPLPGNHHVFLNNRLLSPFEQKCFQKNANAYANEGRSAPSQYHREIASRSRSILLRNIPPGVDDESLRRLLGSFGDVRDLGAQQRVRGGRGSVVATFFDLRHALAAVSSIDSSVQFGRRIEARFHNACSTPPMPRSPLQNSGGCSRNDSSGGSPRDGSSGKHSPFSSQSSPHHSPSNKPMPSPTNQGTLVVFNLEPNTTAEEIRALFGSVGDVKEIRATPNKRHHKFVEFYDVRDAERALQTLNKTEVGGKKIKIEISRPGGRGGHSMRNNSSSVASSHSAEDRSIPSTMLTSQAFSASRTPPSALLSSISMTTDAGHSQPSQAFSPLDRHLVLPQRGQLSPYAAPYSAPPYMSNDTNPSLVHGNQTAGQQNVNSASGNTMNSQAHAFYPGAPTGVSLSPSAGFYNSLRRQNMSSYSTHGTGNHTREAALLESFTGDAIPSNHVRDIDQHIGLSRSLDYNDERNRSARQAPVFDNSHNSVDDFWSNYSMAAVSPDRIRQSSPEGLALPSGSPVGRAAQKQPGIGHFLGPHMAADNGYEVHNRTEDGESGRSPAFSPQSFPQLRGNSGNHAYLEEQNFGVSMPQLSTVSRGYASNATPNGNERPFYGNNVSGTVSPFPRIGSPQDRISGETSGAPKDPPRRKYSAVLQMNTHEGTNRRTNNTSNRSHGNSNSHSNSSSKFTLDIDKVISGDDSRTALMIRNIPNKYNQRMLLAALDENHRGHFDFIYLPIDFKNKCNVGYAFINFTRTEFISDFYNEFHGHKWGRFNSEKVCEITYARIQGKSNLIGHFQNSSLMNEDPKCRPVVFGSDGKQEEFPVGTNVRTRRGPSARDANRIQDNSPPFSPLKQRGRCN